ncbi:MAG: sugar phosphate isomerase/epimerase [Armatimonadetes bacterium]|nr:sugar phosphate isomerase/epimerase [Armatimonadota bacterium]
MATSLNVLYDYTSDIPRAVRRLKAAGFDALDFNGCDMLSLWQGGEGERNLELLAGAAEEHGLPWVQAHGPMFEFWGENAVWGIADTRRCLRWCGRLGVPWMVMHPGHRPGAFDAAHRQRVIEANLEFDRQFIPLMEEHRVGIAIENLADAFHGRRFGSVPEDLLELHTALDHELFGFCWDTGHAFLQGLPQRESIASLGSRLKVLHVQDNDGKGDDHLLPYTRGVAWDEVVAGLQDAGYQGAWTYEIHNAVRHLPDGCRDDALRLAVTVGRHFTGQF